MFQQLLGLFLIGLGVRTPALPGSVMGDHTEVTATVQTTPGPLHADRVVIHTDTQGIHQDRQTVRTDIKTDNPQKIGTDAQKLRTDLQNRGNDIHSLGDDWRTKLASNGAFLQERKQEEDKFRQDILDKRASAAGIFKQQEDAFKARLATITDQAKKLKLQNVSTLISQVNTNRTTAMTNQLNKMDEILAKITSRMNDLSSQGKDITSIQTAMDAAQSALGIAKSAVSSQAGKEYIIDITTPTDLSTNVQNTKKSLEADLKTVNGTIAQARDAVTSVIAALGLVNGDGTK